MAYWLFQGNPKYYRIIDAIGDFVQMPWLVTRYAKDMAAGDGVLIWKAGQDAVLKSLGVIRVPNGTNYKVTPEEMLLRFLFHGEASGCFAFCSMGETRGCFAFCCTGGTRN
jgi:hypothetical protein